MGHVPKVLDIWPFLSLRLTLPEAVCTHSKIAADLFNNPANAHQPAELLVSTITSFYITLECKALYSFRSTLLYYNLGSLNAFAFCLFPINNHGRIFFWWSDAVKIKSSTQWFIRYIPFLAYWTGFHLTRYVTISHWQRPQWLWLVHLVCCANTPYCNYHIYAGHWFKCIHEMRLTYQK